MKRTLLLLAFIATAQAQSLTQYYAENFTTSGINTGAWYPINGSLMATASGLTTSSQGSIISNVAVPDGTSEYEVLMTYKLMQSGGSYVTYLRATPDASLYANTGTFFAIELKDVIVSGSTCTANVAFWKRLGGTTTYVGAQSLACSSTLELRAIMRNGHILSCAGASGLIRTWEPPISRFLRAVPASACRARQPQMEFRTPPC